ncbi:Anti-sigma-L factor RslA [Nonomuraea coxensis DSM 45129]|uniref:Anti-sigma-L factor RslA n=1 Tax=Nonomuraea coxensis DSM 45129 TaxID=1122611 RepID=A0ABX8U747_9ACTN|nr:zf-HC2 domain-containing protein [Nonomuraea coxensis]QYC43534.1 Anti-sigma-L factor RslA [Nonomuraea coxensis DSM 45129]
MTARVEHTDVGAYALGLLEEEDRAAFEAHLLHCGGCRAELSDLAGVASALDGLGPVHEGFPPDSGPPIAPAIDLVRRKRAADRRTRRGTFVIGMAAAVTLVAGGLTVGTQLSGGSTAQLAQEHSGHAGHMGPAEQFYADGRPIEGKGVDGVIGGLVVESKGWGTHAALKLAGVKGPLQCELVSVGRSGERRVMTGWAVPPAGYGVPGSPDPLYMHGGSATPLKEIDHFEVVTATGKRLLTVQV